MAIDWEAARVDFPVLRNWAYFNTASLGPVPARAERAIIAHLRHRDEQACLDFLAWFAEAEKVRAQAAVLIGAAAEDIAFLPNTGTGLSWLLNGIGWKTGDQIAYLANEFPNNTYAPLALGARGIEAKPVSTGGERFSVDEFLDQLTPRTRLVVLSAVNYATGLRPPLAEIGVELQRRGILFYVDGTQSVGALRTDVRAAGVAVMAVHAYKWLLCPPGIGFAYIAPEVREWLQPAVYSWRSDKNWRNVDCLHDGAPELPGGAAKYEGGMQNFSGIFALGAVLEMLNGWGAEAVEQRVLTVSEKVRGLVRSRGGQTPGDGYPYYDSPIIAAHFAQADLQQLSAGLRQQRVAAAVRKGGLRLSPHFFNNDRDLEQLDVALKAGVKK
jgi:selenocysteine lyase/cysteine desulfurase